MVANEVYGKHRIEVETGGHCRFDVQLTNSRHKHNYFEACLVLSGNGVYHHGAGTYALSPGDVFVADPGVEHEITSYRTKDLALFFLTFTIGELDSGRASVEDKLLASFRRRHRIVSSGHKALAGYVRLLEEGDGVAGYALAARQQALKLMCLEMVAALADTRFDAPQEEALDPQLASAFEFIERHLDRRVTVAEVAAHVGVSERSLRRKFRELGGVVGEINNRRMRRAAHRLLMGFSVGEVSDYVGFSDQAQFSRSFKRSFGVSPKRFQASYQPGSLVRQTLPADELA